MPIKWLQPCFWNQILWPCQLIPGKSSEVCETQDRERDEEQPTPPRTSSTGLLRGKDRPPEFLPLLTNAPACTASGILSRLKHRVVARDDQGREVENYTRTKTQSESDRQVSSWCTRRFPRDSCLRVLRFPRESHAVLGLRVSHINHCCSPTPSLALPREGIAKHQRSWHAQTSQHHGVPHCRRQSSSSRTGQCSHKPANRSPQCKKHGERSFRFSVGLHSQTFLVTCGHMWPVG